MDIRKYFGGTSSQISILRGTKTPENKREVDERKTSPVKKSDTNQKVKRKSTVISSDSDPEDPIPRSISKKSGPLSKKSEKSLLSGCGNEKPKHVVIVSDSDRELKKEKQFTKIRKSPRAKMTKSGKKSKNFVEEIDEFSSSNDDADFKEISSNKKLTPTKKSVSSTKCKQSLVRKKDKSKMEEIYIDDEEDFPPPKKKSKPLGDEILLPPLPGLSKMKSPVKTQTRKDDVPKLNPISASEFFGGAKVGGHKKNGISKKPTASIELEQHKDAGFTDVLKKAQGDFISPSSSVAATTPALSTTSDVKSSLRRSPRKRAKNTEEQPNCSLSGEKSFSEKISKSASSVTPSPVKLSKKDLNNEETNNNTLQKSPARKLSFKNPIIDDAELPQLSTKKKFQNFDTPIVVKSKTDKRPVEKSPLVSQQHVDVCSYLPFVEKYKPKNIKQIIGQQGDKSCLNKLLNWLRNWKSWHITKSKEKKKGFGANDDGSFFKAVLLSGSPGIGKTTSAQLCCKELGFSSIELNASDARNKKTIEKHISESLSCHSMDEYMKGTCSDNVQSNDVRHVLIMDEVDGMSGNEDRAGMAELIALIKKTRVPIICICNDRQVPKIRSLANYCYDLRFHKPMLTQIRGPMMSIAFKEGLKLTGQSMDEIVEGASHDIRQVLQHLNLLAADCTKELTADEIKDAAKRAKKDTATNIFETTRTLFSDNETTRSMSLIDKTELFFTDYSLMPLFVFENYLNSETKEKKKMYEKLELYSKAAEAIAVGDRIDRQIRTGGNWSLLNDQAMFSAVIPADTVRGYLHGMTQFPQWFGKNSKQGRFQRILQQLQIHTSLKISSNFTSLNLDYVPAFRAALTRPLIEDDANGVEKVLRKLSAYDLTKDDMDNIIELGQWPKAQEPMSLVAPKVKAALTRAYNKSVHCLPYALDESGKKVKTGKSRSTETMLVVDEEGNETEEYANLNNDEIVEGDSDDDSSDKQEMKKPIVQQQTAKKKAAIKPAKSKSSPANKKGGKTNTGGKGGKKK